MHEQPTSPLLHFEPMHAPGATPSRWLLVLHGVFGSGSNWRLFMRKLAIARPDWGFLLVDQRGHGRSLAPPPPHTIQAMANDLLALTPAAPGPIVGVIGHSLGGKVALAYAAARPNDLEQVWILDSQPGTYPTEHSKKWMTQKVLSMLQGLPPRFATRQAFVQQVESLGFSRMIASWLAMNLRREAQAQAQAQAAGAHYQLGLDLVAIESILTSYATTDLWPELARHDAQRQLHVVVAEKSFVWQPGDQARLDQIAADHPQAQLHRFPEAGHWVHVDAAAALQQRLQEQLSS